jgi:response regulator RpfG family c-di-GMP phosphodiesterase
MNPGRPESENGPTILLVEDEEMTRSFIQRFLEREGYTVIAVDAAEEGIVEAGEAPPDVLISDIHLPGLSGIELASFLLAQDPGMPVILMTGDPDEGLARRALACGPVQYLLKPFEWFEMQAAVHFALGQREDTADLEATPVLELTDEALEAMQSGVDAEAVTVELGAHDVEPEPAAGVEIGPAVLVEPEPVGAVEGEPETAVILSEPEVAASDEPEIVLIPEPPADPNDAWMEEVDRASWAGPGHGDRVARLAIALHEASDDGQGMDAADLALAGRVHEAGRLHLEDADPMDVARYGADVLAEAGFPEAVVESVRFMHERWDGGAEADGLSGARIPPGAQLLAVADALDHYASAWIRSGLEAGEAAERAMNLVTVQQNLAFSPPAVAAMHRAADALRDICAQERPPETTAASPVPELALAESVPFALFATA